jgi:hypothetical protein
MEEREEKWKRKSKNGKWKEKWKVKAAKEGNNKIIIIIIIKRHQKVSETQKVKQWQWGKNSGKQSNDEWKKVWRRRRGMESGRAAATKTKGRNNDKHKNDKEGKGAEERVNQNEI